MDLSLLYELQLKEVEFSNLSKRTEQIKSDDLLKRLSDEYSTLKNQYLSLQSKQNDENKEIETKKRSLKQLEANKKTYEDLKYTPEINNSKKLKMIEKQIIDTDNSIKIEMKRIVEIEGRINKIESEVMVVKKKLFFIKNKAEKTKSDYQQELQGLEQEQKRVGEIIKGLKRKVDEDSMDEYSKWKVRMDDPISLIESRKCTGCSVDVPSINFEAVRAGELIRCECCGRVLLYRNKNTFSL